MSQFRQFWIWGFKIGDNESISQNCSVHLDKGGSEWYDPVHHVIEYSAYEAAQKEIEQLTAALKVAEDEITFVIENPEQDYIGILKDALAEIQKIKKGKM